jgi:hypothetical protein
MDSEIVTKIRDLTDLAARPQATEIGGRFYTLKDLKPVTPPQPAALRVHTLTGLVEYAAKRLTNDGAGEVDAKDRTAVHVVSPTEVRIVSDLDDTFARRDTYAVAEFQSLVGQATPFAYGTFHDAETFNVALQALFADGDDRAKVLALVGNIREESVKTTGDDGTTQSVTARAGVALNAEVKVPNPVTLKPYRTFREIEQPSSLFVLRLRSGNGAPACALFEADGGAWRLEAIQRIAAYLRAALPKDTVVIA